MRLAAWWADFIVRRPLGVVVVSLAAMGMLSLAAQLAPKDLSFTGMLDPSDPELVAYQEAIRNFGASAALVVLLEGEPADLDAAARRLSEELPQRAPVRSLVPPADPQWVIDRAPWLWPDALFDAVLREVEGGDHPGGGGLLAAGAAVDLADRTIRERIQPVPGARLISMAFTSDIFDMAMGGRDYLVVTAAVDDLLAEFGGRVTADYTGLAAIAAQDQNSVFSRIRLMTPITLVLVLALLYSVERRFLRILLAGIALAGSVGSAFGLVSLIMGKLSITSTFFGMLLLGLGIDFAIHLLVALRDAHAHGATPEESVRRAMEIAGPAIVLGAMTTLLATGVLIFVPQPGALDMGLTATLGLAVALVIMLSFLPAAWLLVERRWGHAEPAPRLVLPGIHGAVAFSLRHPRLVLLIAVLLLVLGVGGLPRYEMETDLQHIMSRDVRAVEVDRRIHELFGIAPVSYLAPVESMEEARTLAARMLRQPDVVAVTSPADWVREDAPGRGERMRRALSSGVDLADSVLAARLETALRLGPIKLDEVPLAFRAGTVGVDGGLALQIIPRAALLDSLAIQAQVAQLREIAPQLTGIPVVALLLMAGERDWIPIVLGVITFLVVGLLVVSFRRLRDVILAFLPVVVGSVVSMGVFFLLDLKFSILTGIVVPIILGLGVDDGIHIVERLRRIGRLDDAALLEAVEGVGRAIFLTSATTTLSFLGLFFCNHYGLESMAQFMSMGMPLCFVASITVLPAAVVLLRPKT